jgi:hypothetical protein
MRAVALACCLAILIALGISAEGDEKPAASATQRLDAEALELAKLLDGGGFFARIGRGLELSLKEDVELPRLLLAKHHSNRPETKALLLHAVDQILTRRAPKLNQFPLAWAKEDLAERRWTAALTVQRGFSSRHPASDMITLAKSTGRAMGRSHAAWGLGRPPGFPVAFHPAAGSSW